jgi:nucleotide-binding universal stress UspA family protein
MFKRILVPVDFTPKNRRALRLAVEMARPERATITLLHVIERIELVPDAELRGFYQKLEGLARRQLAAMAASLAKRGCTVRQRTLRGSRVAEIVKSAASMDLVMLASHRVSPRRLPRGWDTLSYRVAVLAPCPVLLVK